MHPICFCKSGLSSAKECKSFAAISSSPPQPIQLNSYNISSFISLSWICGSSTVFDLVYVEPQPMRCLTNYLVTVLRNSDFRFFTEIASLSQTPKLNYIISVSFFSFCFSLTKPLKFKGEIPLLPVRLKHFPYAWNSKYCISKTDYQQIRRGKIKSSPIPAQNKSIWHLSIPIISRTVLLAIKIQISKVLLKHKCPF